MRRDASERVEKVTLTVPPASGPGSGKDAWRALAQRMLDSNDSLSAVIAEQKATIAELNAEVDLLRRQIATRKPKGGKPAVDDETVQRIEVALLAGASTRQIAQRYKVSAMTVSRIKKRMDSRKADAA